MLIRNGSRLILQFSHLLTKFTPRKSRKISLIKCNAYCVSSSYAASDGNESEYSLSDKDDGEEFNFETEEVMSEKLMEELAAGDVAKLGSLKRAQLLVHLLREKGVNQAPTQIGKRQWLRLITYENKKDQILYLNRLHQREYNRKLAKTVSDISRKRFLKKEEERSSIKVTTSGPLIYRLYMNNLFLRLRNLHIDRFYNYRLLQAMMFAPTILVDCGYESFLVDRHIDRTSVQIIQMWARNRDHVSPFHIQFCNLNPQGLLMERLREGICNIDDPAYPFFHSSKSYLEMYPKEKLVYLTPHVNSVLTKFNADDIYILGPCKKKSFFLFILLRSPECTQYVF